MKPELRRLMKIKLSSIDQSMLKTMSSSLSKNLHQLLGDLHVIQKNICIGSFAPIAAEPLWNSELSEDLMKLTAFPAMDMDTNKMTFKMARMSDLIVRKDFGFDILGPDINAPEVETGVVLVPGLAFTEKGERLGRGKGFYDKFLSNYRGVKIGVCFSEQLLATIPTEEHDVTLDYIVTEEKIINCMRA